MKPSSVLIGVAGIVLLAVVVVTFRSQRDGSGTPTRSPGDGAGDKSGITVQPTPVASGEAFRPLRDGSGALTRVPGDDAGEKFGITVQPTPVASGEAIRIFFSVPETEVSAIKRWLSDTRGAAMFTTTQDGKEVNHGGILARNAHVVRHVEVRQGDIVLYEQTIPVPAAGGVVPGSFSLTSDSFQSRPTASMGDLQVSIYFNRHYEYSSLKMIHNLCSSTVWVPVK